MDEQDLGRQPGLIASTPEDFGFGQLFWEMRDAVVGGDVVTGRIVLWNPAAEDLFAIPREAAIGRPIETLMPATLRAQHSAGLARFRETGHGALIDTGQPVELPALRGTGEPITIELRLSPITASHIPGRFVLAIIRDATLRKQAEQDRLHLVREQAARVAAEYVAEALRQSEERFRSAFAYAPIGMDVVDLDGRFLRVNAALCHLTGYTESELLATTYQDITHPDDRVADLTLSEQLLAGAIPALQTEKRYLRKDGSVIWTRINASLVRDQHGAPLHFIGQVEDISDRKRADAELAQRTEELQVSEGRFRSLVEQLPAAVYLLATKEHRERPLYFSPSITAVTGETPEAALISHQHWIDLVHPEDRARVAAADAQSGADVAAFHAEYRHRRTDGTYVWVQDEYVPVKDVSGRVVAWQGMLLDITDRIRVEEAQAQLAAIVDAAEEGILSCTPDGMILSWNRGAERLYGYTAEEAIGQSVAMLRPPELADDIAEVMARVRHGESIEGHETVRLTRDGRRVDVSLSITPMRDVRGAVVAIASISRDITALHAAETAVWVRNRALAAATNGVLITDPTLPDDPIVDVNPAFELITGYTRAEVIGRNCRFLQGADTDPETLQRLRMAIAEGREITETVRNYRKDGTLFWNEVHIAPVRDAAGVLTHFVGIQTDVTERKAVEVALHDALGRVKASLEAKDRFLTMMSHELRTPLQSVLGYADLLLQARPDTLDADQREDLGAIQRGATRMVTLIEQTLDLSRMQAGHLVLERASLDLASLLRQVCQDLAPQADAKGIALQVDDSELPPIVGDLGRVYQILLNLVANAVKFTPVGEVRLTAQLTDTGVAIMVRDTGIGMEPETLAHIFEEYHQGEGGVQRRYGGTGLGLTIASRLAHEMGGRITVESEVGRGSCFTLHLPLLPPSTPLGGTGNA